MPYFPFTPPPLPSDVSSRKCNASANRLEVMTHNTIEKDLKGKSAEKKLKQQLKRNHFAVSWCQCSCSDGRGTINQSNPHTWHIHQVSSFLQLTQLTLINEKQDNIWIRLHARILSFGSRQNLCMFSFFPQLPSFKQFSRLITVNIIKKPGQHN